MAQYDPAVVQKLMRDYIDRMWLDLDRTSSGPGQRLTAAQVMRQQAAINAQHTQLQNQLGAQPYGRHWSSSQALHGSPAGVPGSGSGGGAGGPASATPYHPTLPEPYTPPAIEEAGIRAGEIIAWRVWRVWRLLPQVVWGLNSAGHQVQIEQTPLLRSTYKHTIWEPGQTMEAHADPTTQKYDPESHANAEFVGIFAWKTLGQLCQYVQRQFGVRYNDPIAMQMDMEQPPLLVTGQVTLWGSVIEHEHGYRAQFARPHRLFMVSDADGEQVNETLRVELCKLYGLPEEGV